MEVFGWVSTGNARTPPGASKYFLSTLCFLSLVTVLGILFRTVALRKKDVSTNEARQWFLQSAGR